MAVEALASFIVAPPTATSELAGGGLPEKWHHHRARDMRRSLTTTRGLVDGFLVRGSQKGPLAHGRHQKVDVGYVELMRSVAHRPAFVMREHRYRG